MTNLHLLRELAGLFSAYEHESAGQLLVSCSLQFASTVDPGVGEEPTMSEVYQWNGARMVVPEVEVKEEELT